MTKTRGGLIGYMKEFIELLKLPPSVLSAISIGTGLIIFLPKKTLERMGLDTIPLIWRTVIGISFIVSLSLLLVYFILKIIKNIKNKIFDLKFKRYFPKVMQGLNYQERRIVALLMKSENYTSRLPMNDGVTLRLTSKLIIQITASQSYVYGDNMRIPYTITPGAQKYVMDHLEMLEEFGTKELQELYDRYNGFY